MTDYALDYSAGWPAPAAVKAAGFMGVIRYIGFDPALRPKCIGKAEYAAMTGAGLGVALVYENQAGDALQGRAAGVTAATRARQWADRIGFPADRPIYMACDTDVVTPAQFAAVLDYLRGAAEVHGGPGRVGVYGEADVIERAAAAGVARWFWQTKAWSHGIVSDHDHLLQVLGQATVGGVVCDRNEIHQPDWGQTGAQQEAAMPTADDLWNTQIDWPTNLADDPPLPHAKGSYTAREWLTGAAVNAARAVRGAEDAQTAVARVAATVAALSNDEAHVLAAVAGAEARLAAALVAEGSAVEAKLIEAIRTAPAGPGGSDPAAVVAAFRDALTRGTAGPT